MEEKIFITMEEYKELLMTKGKYEELKSQQLQQKVETKPNWSYRGITTTLDDNNSVLLCNAKKEEPEFNF